jgi:serine/threonine protein kinase
MYQAKQRVGEYVLDELVGQTAYAEEWRAHHHAWSDQQAVVKIPTDPQYVNNLRQEGIRLHRLVHPNILCPLGFDPTAQPPYLITEYIQSQTLRAWIDAKRLTVGQSVNVLRHLLEALQFGHERQVVHGDVRPENILLDTSAASSDFASTGSVKVTDFGVGIAAAATITQDPAAKAQPHGGSLAYLAPEQRDGAPPDVKSDIYAVGVVLFEMLTGERPGGAELPSELNPQVPSWLDDVFKKSYARRDRRFESARAFLDALSRPSVSVSPAAPPPAPAAEIRFRQEPQSPPPGVSEEPKAGDEIALAPEDGAAAPIPPAPSARTDAGAEDSQPISLLRDGEPAPSAPALPADDEQLVEEQQEAGADTAAMAQDQIGGEPVLPVIPRVPSPADRDALFDELNKKQVRTAEELRAALKGYFEIRDMDQGESANIRLRLMKWANALAGGNAELEEHITLINAAARPLYIVKLLLRSTRGDEPIRSQTLEHLIGEQAGSALRSGDYRLIGHFSATALNERLLESISNTSLRTAVMNLTREARREFFGRMQREDLLIFRANIITAAYRFDRRKYRAFMVGNALSVVSAGEPFTKIRQEPTKRAATLLNGEQLHQGIKELRRALDDPQWETKANEILSAWRGKLAAAYVEEARQHFNNYGWLESLQYSAKAGQLVPGQEDALAHAALVRKRIGQLQLLPGTFIAVVLVGLAFMWAYQTVSPPQPKPLLIQTVQSPLFAAGVAAWIATLWSKAVLKARMARTDFAFYQAAVFPLLVALPIAFVKYPNPTSMAICGGLLIAVVVADVMIFKKLRRHLLRRTDDPGLIGDGLTVLNRIETLLADDWERLRPHYLQLGPLYSFTSVQAAQASMADLFEAPVEGLSDDTVDGSLTGSWTPKPSPDLETGNPEVDRLVGQMNARISANLRTLAPAARVLLTIFGEYSKAVSNHQIGMMQANAAKIEQKGKDLAGRVADFERLCRSPLTLDAGENQDLIQQAGDRLAKRAEEPDIKLLKSLADRAKDFREDQSRATSDLAALVPQVEAAIERLKKG